MKAPSQQALDALQKRLGYRFVDVSLLTRALTHRSAARDHNERLEFLGDAVIGVVVASAFFDRFPQANEGELSRLRAGVVSGVSLAGIARSLKLSECLILGESERKSGGRNRDSILTDTLEALAGAIMMDSSLSGARTVVSGWLQSMIEGSTLDIVIDAKTRLQEWLQARGEPLPEYVVTSVSGEDHAQCFQVQCKLGERGLTTEASGSARRRAEQTAAELMLDALAGGQNV
ncbi:MAG: ribonuclease III [Luminiphilus sp.]